MTRIIKLLTAIFFTVTLITSVSMSQTTYIWVGAQGSNFSTATNWSPVRQVGLVTDILVFETGTSLNVINVNQLTIGQLIIRNNTNLTLSPSTGNAKCLTIKGNSGTDLLIESGSGLKIFGSDPMLNLYLSGGATGEIFGNLTIEGNTTHNINSANPDALCFKNGSLFTQKSPGNIFNRTGANNSVVFEAGSIFKIEHPEALNPFGLTAPHSKVVFENGSELIIKSISDFQLNGREVSNLTIEQGVTLNLTEEFTSDITLYNITVKNGGNLNLTNTNPNYIPSVNIKGDIDVTGSLGFTVNSSKFNVILNGTGTQHISGSGEFALPLNLNTFVIDNNIVLNRNLQVNCRYIHQSGEVNLNGFNLFTGGKNPALINISDKGENLTSTNENTKLNSNLPDNYSVSQNYPNPFNPSTKIDFALPVSGKVVIKVYDITGKEAATVLNSEMTAGSHTVQMNSGSLSSGVFFYTITAGSYSKTLKMIIAK